LMYFVDEGMDVYCVECFAEVQGYHYGAFRGLFLVESLNNLIDDLMKCCGGRVENFEAMLV
jgi:hypothetical protein